MAQARVTEFFNTRKKNGDFQPSKRRKITESMIEGSQLQPQKSSPAISSRTRSRGSKITTIAPPAEGPEAQDKASPLIELPKVKTTSKAKATRKATTKSRNSKTRSIDVSQKTIEDSFKKSSKIEVQEEIPTAICDDHCASPPSSPSKRQTSADAESTVISKKRSKGNPVVRKDLMLDLTSTPEKGYDFSKFSESLKGNKQTARKKLILNRPPSPKQVDVKTSDPTTDTSEKLDISEGAEKVVTLTPEVLKLKLAKCGKLDELKEKLAEFAKAKAKGKKTKSSTKEPNVKPDSADDSKAKASLKVTEKAPAYERFHHLATPAPPSLTLPYSYKNLEMAFQGMDTVVSMLHNRSEICTFARLKPAVELMTRKQFNLDHICQIQSVYDDAYILRQEKGLPAYGKKTTGYQLTVEPQLCQVSPNVENQLKGMSEDAKNVNKNGKHKFSAAHILERKDVFHRLLIGIVRLHHKEFLSTLENPMSVPEDQLARWHPKFKLDEVPAVAKASIPMPPDVKVLTTAREVLEASSKMTLNPRVKAALEIVAKAKEAESKEVNNKSVGVLSKEEKKAMNNSPKQACSKLSKSASGMESLLQKIRAKESQKQKAAMTRSPEDEARISRLERLPELVRILRTYYISRKKPAIATDEAVQCMIDSYRSNISKAESEKHLQLILELVPEWVTQIKISKGTFLKINKEKDLNSVVGKIDKLLKEAR